MVEPVQVSSVTVVWTTKSRLTIATKRLWGFGPWGDNDMTFLRLSQA